MSSLTSALRTYFGFTTFRPGQERIIDSILSGRDVLLVMPTGAGKSLCFQLPALMMEGTTLVVSPLISLMKDQVDALSARHLPATFLNSSLSSDEANFRMERMREGAYKLVYIAPERFRSPHFLELLAKTKLAMLAIDEAHCISQWGHDFRPDYLYLETIVKQLPTTVRIMAVTATATDSVRHDIQQQLCMGQLGRTPPEVIVMGFERPNLALNVTAVRTHAEKLERVRSIIEFFGVGIIYCSTRKMVERVQLLLEKDGITALAYNGTMGDEERTQVQDAFMNREAPVVIATNAFGMGVDRSDIRFVVHWDVPGSIEAYYQEVGRAGRDGGYAWCELLFNYADVRTQRFFLDSANPPEEQVREFYAVVSNQCAQTGGQAALTIEDWAALAGLKSTTIIRNLLAMFERTHLIAPIQRLGRSEVVVQLNPKADLQLLNTICSELVHKRQLDLARLDEMLDYVKARGCRHRFLMSYFGEAHPARSCEMCDHCHPATLFPRRAQPSASRLILLRKMLSCVARLQKYASGDRATVVGVLKGHLSAYQSLSTFGLLRDVEERKLQDEYDGLVLDGYIHAGHLSGRGYDLVFEKMAPVPIALSGPFTLSADNGTVAMAHETQPRSTPPLKGLAVTLREWVAKEAATRGLPTYMVLQQKTITALAKLRPATLTELELVPGLGDIKIAKYGEQILEIINQ